MKKNGIAALALMLVLVALLAGAGVLYDRLTRETPAPQAEAAPTVTLAPQAADATATPKQAEVAGPQPKADLAPVFTAYTEEGEAVRLSDLRGKPAVVNFFASWCGPCRSEMPHFDEAYRTYGEDIGFLMVDLCAYGNDTVADAKALVESGGWSFPVCYDTQGEAVTAYGIRSMPTTIFLTADGVLAGKRIGAMTREQLWQEIDALLSN